ncbi:MAG TPA: hypothetical protein VGT41_01100 [Candidatus Babeliales bacterium]|nr:hypothetical protein [Candidatus Babeliales bacterium]
MKQQIGIVLRKDFTKSRTIFLFDKDNGKMECTPTSYDVCLGALVQYQRVTQRSRLITISEVIALPHDVTHINILFFHHVLEICFHFLPMEAPAQELFALLEQLYTRQGLLVTAWHQKLFIAKILLYFGMYPEDSDFPLAYLHRIAYEPIDIMMHRSINLGFEAQLDRWLHGCIMLHPNIEQFKTIHFLDESRIV